MAITIIRGNPVRSSGAAGSSSWSLTYEGAVASGDILIGHFVVDGSTITGVSDDVNGAWTKAVAEPGFSAVEIWYKLNSAAGTPEVTATYSDSSNSFDITLLAIRGTSIALGSTNHATGTGTSTPDPGAITIAATEALIFGGVHHQGSEQTAGSGYTLLNSTNGAYNSACQYQIFASTGSKSTAFTYGGFSGAWGATAAAFEESGGGAPATRRYSLPTLGAG